MTSIKESKRETATIIPETLSNVQQLLGAIIIN